MLIYDEFYPTPAKLIDKMLSGIDFRLVANVLEPSAGKGDIADVLFKKLGDANWRRMDRDKAKTMIDCIELQEDLQHILTGKGYTVVHDDFLSFRTHKQYDLIVMNPPFSNGDAHLWKALELVKHGGTVICILNAETLRNPYTNLRRVLSQKLEDYSANIDYLTDQFTQAERKTNVEIAVVKVTVPEAKHSFILDGLEGKSYDDVEYECQELVGGDFIAQAVTMYEKELSAGIQLINEYKALLPKIQSAFNDKYSRPLLEMKVYRTGNCNVNDFVEAVRLKYWDTLFRNKKFNGMLTSNLQDMLYDKVHELKAYDFSVHNILKIQRELSMMMGQGIEDTIVALFDKLSGDHAWYPETKRNIHYYNGWSTNKAHYINKKVIIPINGAFSEYSWSAAFEVGPVVKIMSDIERALDYLDNSETPVGEDMKELLKRCADEGQTKKIPMRYFNITLYKKGTCHIEFTNQKLLDRLNIYGSQRKGWLPPCYGKKRYDDMTKAEKAVVDDFQGKEAYSKVIANPTNYIIEPKHVLALTG